MGDELVKSSEKVFKYMSDHFQYMFIEYMFTITLMFYIISKDYL